jgi:hypothetical protein
MLAAYFSDALPNNSFCDALCFIDIHSLLSCDDLQTIALDATSEAYKDIKVEVGTTTLVRVVVEWTLDISLPVIASNVCSIVDEDVSDTW